MTQRDILMQVANQTAPGTSLGDDQSFSQFVAAEERKFLSQVLQKAIAGIEDEIRSFGAEPAPLPPDSTLADIIFERERQLKVLDPTVVARSKQEVSNIVRGLLGLKPLIPESAVDNIPGGLGVLARAGRNLTSPTAVVTLPFSSPSRLGLAFASQVLPEELESAGAPLPVQLAAEIGASLIGGNILDDIAERGLQGFFRDPGLIARALSDIELDDAAAAGLEALPELIAAILASEAAQEAKNSETGRDVLDRAQPLLVPLFGADELGPLTGQELDARIDFVLRNPGIEALPPVEQDNLFLADQIRLLGGNPEVIIGVGVDERALFSRNRVLRDRLDQLQEQELRRTQREGPVATR